MIKEKTQIRGALLNKKQLKINYFTWNPVTILTYKF